MSYLISALQEPRAPQRCSTRTSKSQEKQAKGEMQGQLKTFRILISV